MRSRGGLRAERWSRILPGLLLLALSSPAPAQPSELAVKAAFLPKFAAYVGWPPDARPGSGAPIQLCVIGADPFGRMIDDAARSQQVDRRSIAVRRLDGAAGADGCHLAFVQGTASHSTQAILGALSGKPVLTVTDARVGPQRGIVHFVVHQGRVRFHIDDAAAARGGLAISSRLLALALTVRQRRG